MREIRNSIYNGSGLVNTLIVRTFQRGSWEVARGDPGQCCTWSWLVLLRRSQDVTNTHPTGHMSSSKCFMYINSFKPHRTSARRLPLVLFCQLGSCSSESLGNLPGWRIGIWTQACGSESVLLPPVMSCISEGPWLWSQCPGLTAIPSCLQGPAHFLTPDARHLCPLHLYCECLEKHQRSGFHCLRLGSSAGKQLWGPY